MAGRPCPNRIMRVDGDDILASDTPTPFPQFPPGFWRRIRIVPGQRRIAAALEDDAHHMTLSLDHDGDSITAVRAETFRAPYSTCTSAPAFLESQLRGQRLDGLNAVNIKEHCTHLFDLAITAIAHGRDTAPVTYDVQVSEREDTRRTGTLFRDGRAMLRWQVDGTMIAGPEPWGGRDMRGLSQWQTDLSATDALHAMLLRRAIFVSGVREQPEQPVERASDRGPGRMGACFTLRMPRAQEALHLGGRWQRDFSTGGAEPLAEFDQAAASVSP